MDIKTVRREVTTMANRINRKFHNLSMSLEKLGLLLNVKCLFVKLQELHLKIDRRR